MYFNPKILDELTLEKLLDIIDAAGKDWDNWFTKSNVTDLAKNLTKENMYEKLYAFFTGKGHLTYSGRKYAIAKKLGVEIAIEQDIPFAINEVIVALLFKVKYPEKKFCEHQSPFKAAIIQQDEALIEAMMAQGASPTLREADGYSPLQFAVNRAHYVIANKIRNSAYYEDSLLDVRFSLEKAILVNNKDAFDFWLGVAKSSQFFSQIKSFLDYSTDDSSGDKLLHLAAKKGNEHMILALIKSEADINVLNRRKESFMHFLMSTSRQPIFLKVLKQESCNFNRSVLGRLLMYSFNVIDKRFIKPILECITDKSILNEFNLLPEKYFALHLAVKKRLPDIIKQLMDMDADPNVFDANDRTPFVLALEENKFDIANIIWQHPKNNITEDSAGFALLCCVNKDQQDFFDKVLAKATELKLIEKNANIIQTSYDKSGNNMLHLAVEQGNIIRINALMDLGVNAAKINLSYLSPLAAAIRNHNSKAASAILAHKNHRFTNESAASALFEAVNTDDVVLVKLLIQLITATPLNMADILNDSHLYETRELPIVCAIRRQADKDAPMLDMIAILIKEGAKLEDKTIFPMLGKNIVITSILPASTLLLKRNEDDLNGLLTPRAKKLFKL